MGLFPARILDLPVANPFDQALMLDERGDAASASRFYKEAIRTGVNAADAYCNLGIIKSATESTSEALTCFAKALVLDPGHIEGRYNLAVLYMDQGEFELAQLHLEMAAKLDPGAPHVQYSLGVVHALNGNQASAVASLRMFQALSSPDEAARAEALLRTLGDEVAQDRRD